MPKITKMEVYPVAGKDSMELNLSGAHAPFFTRNIVILYADNGDMGIGEVPGGTDLTVLSNWQILLFASTDIRRWNCLASVRRRCDAK